MEQKEKIGLFQMVQIAVAKPSNYRQVLNAKKRTIVLFVMFVSFLLLFLGSIVPMLGFAASIGGPEHFITETLPKFQYKDGTFYVEHRIEIDNDGFRLIADSDVDKFTKNDLKDDSSTELLVAKNNMQVKDAITGQTFALDFSDTGKESFNNKDLVEMLPLFYMATAIVFAFAYVSGIIGYVLGALVIALFGRSIGKSMKKEYSYSEIFIFALMARMTAGIINTMGVAADISFFHSPIWMFLEFAIIMLYLYFGIKGPEKLDAIGL
ncbi:MAG: DUF1189 family protein [Lachnospiraceae bacterium]|nr:DUF1189 family protein [Lachnospiraceae bacterium]